MTYRSHSKSEILHALKSGEPVWELDTQTDGKDDYLIGSYQDVVQDILTYHEIDQLPEHWQLIRVEF